MFERCKTLSPSLAVPIWTLLVAMGLFQLYEYKNAPSVGARAPATFPANSQIVEVEGASSLLVFVHPHCPCSNASIDELERIVSQSVNATATTVVFWHPSSTAANWHETALWNRTRTIPGIRVLDDAGCTVTRQFRVSTSGQALLYDPTGRLRFAGGITQARGHAGDNVGSDAILALAKPETTSRNERIQCCAVFGCPLEENRRSDLEGESQ